MSSKYVDRHIELQLAWCRWYKHLYYPCGGGESPIDDDLYDQRFRHFEEIYGLAGCECVHKGPPPLPDRAIHPVDIDLYGLKPYDIMTECRKDRKNESK